MDTNFIKPLDSFVDEAIGYLPDYLKKDNLTKFLTVFLGLSALTALALFAGTAFMPITFPLASRIRLCFPCAWRL